MEAKIDLPNEVSVERVKLFCRLQQLEVWFRELVYVEMKCRYGPTWWDECRRALERYATGVKKGKTEPGDSGGEVPNEGSAAPAHDNSRG